MELWLFFNHKRYFFFAIHIFTETGQYFVSMVIIVCRFVSHMNYNLPFFTINQIHTCTETVHKDQGLLSLNVSLKKILFSFFFKSSFYLKKKKRCIKVPCNSICWSSIFFSWCYPISSSKVFHFIVVSKEILNLSLPFCVYLKF